MSPKEQATFHSDVIHVALHHYFKHQNLTPMDALPHAIDSAEWKAILLSMMGTTVNDTLRTSELITSDPVQNRAQFDTQIKEAQARTMEVSLIAGMLCHAWTNDAEPPYKNDSKLIEALAFIQLKTTL
jgi:hypothetical protein